MAHRSGATFRRFAIVLCLLWVPLLTRPGLAQSPPAGTLLRGNFHVHTAISSDGRPIDTGVAKSDHPYAEKLTRMLDSARTGPDDPTGLDIVGLSDHIEAMTDEHWLVTRGVASQYAQKHPGFVPLPGFEWTVGDAVAKAGFGEAFHINVFGSDHFVGTRYDIKWPVLRTGLLLPAPSTRPLPKHMVGYIGQAGANDRPEGPRMDSFPNAILNVWGPQDLDRARSEPVVLGQNWPVESAWGNQATEGNQATDVPPVALDLAARLQLEGIARIATIHGRARSRMESAVRDSSEGLSEEEISAIVGRQPHLGWAQDLRLVQDELYSGLARRSDGYSLSLPPGLPAGNPWLDEADRAALNGRIRDVYAEYYAFLWQGVNLYRGYLDGVSRARAVSDYATWTEFQDDLERSKEAWWRAKQPTDPYQTSDATAFYKWLDSYSNDGNEIVGQFNHLAWGKFDHRIKDLTPEPEHLTDKVRDRMCLLEVACGQDEDDIDGVHPADAPVVAAFINYEGVAKLQPYYDLALRSGWRVAPSSGVDNLGPLNAHSSRLDVPRARHSFTGVWLEDPLDSDPGERMKGVLRALQARRTFVSENPIVNASFYARHANGVTQLGDDLFRETTDSKVQVTFVLELIPQDTGEIDRLSLRNSDIRLVQVIQNKYRGSSEWKDVLYQSTYNIDPKFLSKVITEDTTFSRPEFTRWAVRITIDEVIKRAFGSAPISASVGEAADAARPSYGRDLPGPGSTFRLFSPTLEVERYSPGGAICYYALVKFPNGEHLITAPIWVVGGDWSKWEAM